MSAYGNGDVHHPEDFNGGDGVEQQQQLLDENGEEMLQQEYGEYDGMLVDPASRYEISFVFYPTTFFF